MIESLLENKISKEKNILVVLLHNESLKEEVRYLIDKFCGTVVNNLSEIPTALDGKRIYAIGDISRLKDERRTIHIIEEFSNNLTYANKENLFLVTLGEVPIIVSNAGVYYRRLFKEDNCFNKIKSEHIFQELTESTKQSKALRKGIYLSNITKEETKENPEKLHFHLLRCSSNLTGPTDNFRFTDHKIINLLNDCIKYVFEYKTDLNHVLAQIYENKKKTEEQAKEVKSKIKAHSDKTKDMPKDGLIAFCTFYEDTTIESLSPSNTDRYDLCFKQTSALTKLHFKLKSVVPDNSLEKEFSVTLYPNSAFLIPLSTNRLYTHEIRPSVLSVEKIPVRMGYVVRCSNLEALHMDSQTYIKENGNLIKLEHMTPELMQELRNSYYEENVSEKIIEYGKIHFSMNLGDYKKPIF